jgi:ribosome biogenesis protein SSF1/2
VVLFNLVSDKDGEFIEFRHYGISARQRSVNKSIKRLVNNKKVPNLSRYNDIADYIFSKGGGYSSESEVDDLPGSKIVLPEDFQDKKKNTNVAIKLHELGPRLKLKLIKIEEGICRGNVVFHSYVKKSKGEIKMQMDELKKKRELKAERKRI